MKTMVILVFLQILDAIMSLPVDNTSLSPEQVHAITEIADLNKNLKIREKSLEDTENGLEGPCKSVTVLFARGTGESGNVGDDHSPGPPMFAELRKSLGNENVAVQGVDYSANVLGFLAGGDEKGIERLSKLTDQAASKCPNSKIILSGYSQGAQLVHEAIDDLSSEVSSKVAAAVLFGDPFIFKDIKSIPSSSILSICHHKDSICFSGPGFSGHLSYPEDARRAADFIIDKIK